MWDSSMSHRKQWSDVTRVRRDHQSRAASSLLLRLNSSTTLCESHLITRLIVCVNILYYSYSVYLASTTSLLISNPSDVACSEKEP